jgi:hypothetical protein
VNIIRFLRPGGAVLPGILVMLNDVDSEIESLNVVFEANETVTFKSALDGGCPHKHRFTATFYVHFPAFVKSRYFQAPVSNITDTV